MESFITHLQSLSPVLIYLLVFFVAYIENIFPPAPSDLLIVFGGSLVGIGRVGFVETLLISTAGSTLGFMTMYKIGDWFGLRILEKGKIKFIPLDAVKKVEGWFARYGYAIIIANRFLSGTRAVVSFFAGMSELKLTNTAILCGLSALAWNSLLITGGYYLGNNWQRIGFYLSTYSQIVTAVLIVAALILIARFLYTKRSNGTKPA